MKTHALYLCYLFIFFSCSHITWKENWGPKAKIDKFQQTETPVQKVPEEVIQKINGKNSIKDNWAQQYYQKTYFIVTNPRLLETKKEIDKICDGQDLMLSVDYQNESANEIPLKESPVTFSTADGFSKKVLISKGVCRELSLFKAVDLNQNRQIRKSIKKIVLSYMYNEGTYLKEIVFSTPYKNVEFLVE